MAFKFSECDLGDFNAQDDERFAEHWVPNCSMNDAAHDRVAVVIGSKGVGKTAFGRYLTEQLNDATHPTTRLDLSDFAYAPIAEQVSRFAHSTSDSPVSVLARYWRHLFRLHALREVMLLMDRDPKWPPYLRNALIPVLEKHDRRIKADGLLTRWLKATIDYLDRLLIAPDRPPNVHFLTEEELEGIDKLTTTSGFEDACVSAAGFLRGKQQKLVIVVDGLDKVAARTESTSYDLVISSLISAAESSRNDEHFGSCWCQKILMPNEFYFEHRPRDQEHIYRTRVRLRWSGIELRNLVNQRLAVEGRDRFKCTAPNIDEITSIHPEGFGLLLRHSLHRPRFLLKLLDELRRLSGGSELTKEIVDNSIQTTCQYLCQHLVDEYRLQLPRLEEFMRALAGNEPITSLRKIRSSLGTLAANGANSGVDCYAAIQTLYAAGIIGCVQSGRPFGPELFSCKHTIGSTSEEIWCEFIYKVGARPFWLPDLPDDQLVAINPIAHKFLGTNCPKTVVVG